MYSQSDFHFTLIAVFVHTSVEHFAHQATLLEGRAGKCESAEQRADTTRSAKISRTGPEGERPGKTCVQQESSCYVTIS
jgi:hypothetical protein